MIFKVDLLLFKFSKEEQKVSKDFLKNAASKRLKGQASVDDWLTTELIWAPGHNVHKHSGKCCLQAQESTASILLAAVQE